jgi:hypothetical protein
VQGGARGEGVLEDGLDPAVELRRLERRAQHRNAPGPGQLEQRFRRIEVLGDEHRREVVLEEALQHGAARGRIQGGEIGDLRLAEHMQPVGNEAAVIAGERQAGRGDVVVRDQAVEPGFARQGLEMELVAGGEEVAEAQKALRRRTGAGSGTCLVLRQVE